MKGILGKKIGMTQVFDSETGVVTPVTVIEAGPCPVVQVKTNEVDVERNLLLVKGAVPGPKNGFVEIREDKKR